MFRKKNYQQIMSYEKQYTIVQSVALHLLPGLLILLFNIITAPAANRRLDFYKRLFYYLMVYFTGVLIGRKFKFKNRKNC
jgi:hypothetical protein